MFTVKAAFSDTFSTNAVADSVRDVFSDLGNFRLYFPGIESVALDSAGASTWKIRQEIPTVGTIIQSFRAVDDSDDDFVSWIPAPGVKDNFLRFIGQIFPSETGCSVKFSVNVELRRNKASELHLLAGFIGENAISSIMTRELREMAQTFIARVKDILEEKI